MIIESQKRESTSHEINDIYHFIFGYAVKTGVEQLGEAQAAHLFLSLLAQELSLCDISFVSKSGKIKVLHIECCRKDNFHVSSDTTH